MSEMRNGMLGLYGAKHSQCKRMMTLDFKV